MRRPREGEKPPGEHEPLDLAMLYQRNAEIVARWAWRLGGPMIDVEDVVQEVFVVVHRRLDRYRPTASFRSWLYGITARVVSDRRRKERRRRRWSGPAENIEQIAAPGPTPLDQLERRRALTLVYRVLEHMRDNNRNVFILFELEGLSGEEIAQLTGTRLDTVWVRLHRARKQFNELLQKLAPTEVE